MHKLTTAATLCLVAACTTDESPLVGAYACTTTQSTAFTEPPNAESTTVSTTQTAVVSDHGGGKLAVELTSTGSVTSATCPPLRFSSTDLAAQLEPGQSCDLATSNGNFNIVLTWGELHLTGDQLNGAFNGSVTGRWLINGTAMPGIGTMAQSKACARI